VATNTKVVCDHGKNKECRRWGCSLRFPHKPDLVKIGASLHTCTKTERPCNVINKTVQCVVVQE
jgi:hypothetical protein